MNPKVVYATSGWGVHDDRWVAGLAAAGFAVVRAGDPAGVAELVATSGAVAVLAGPLFTVTGRIGPLRVPLIGLSWGFDLNEEFPEEAGPGTTTWLSALGGLIVDSPTTRSIAITLGVDPELIHLIPWGVDLGLNNPDGLALTAKDYGLPVGSRLILSLRRHDGLYRTEEVIESFALAASRAPDLALVMGGSGPLTAMHTARIAALGLSHRFHLLGQVDEAELPAVLRGADMYVTASQSDGTSVTLLQAMACGIPVIASQNSGNAPWVISGVTGQTFPVGDIHDLAELMAVGGRDPLAEACSRRARTLVESQADWHRNRLSLASIIKGKQ